MSEEGEQRQKRQRVQASVQDEELSMPTDTELVLQSMFADINTVHPLAFVHQLHVVMKNKSVIDEEIAKMRTGPKSIKCLQCVIKQSTGAKAVSTALAIMKTDTYCKAMHSHLSKACANTEINVDRLCDRFSAWITQTANISMSRSDLRKAPPDSVGGDVGAAPGQQFLSDVEIDVLIQAGFLHYRNSVDIDDYAAVTSSAAGSSFSSATGDQELFWLSHPALRHTISCLTAAELEIVSEIKKTRYREISERKLQKLCATTTTTTTTAPPASAASAASGKGSTKARRGLLRDSPFPLSYHLLDLEGRGIIYKVAAPATNDYVIRLRS